MDIDEDRCYDICDKYGSKEEIFRLTVKALNECSMPHKVYRHLSRLFLNNMAKRFVMPFGKHEGKKISDIPHSYLEWVCEDDNDINLKSVELNHLIHLLVARKETDKANAKELLDFADKVEKKR